MDGKSSICVRREVMWLLFKFCIIMVVKGYWCFMVCSFGLAFWDLLRYHLDRLGLLLIKKILRLRDSEKKRHQIVARFRNRIFIWICFMLKARRYFWYKHVFFSPPSQSEWVLSDSYMYTRNMRVQRSLKIALLPRKHRYTEVMEY